MSRSDRVVVAVAGAAVVLAAVAILLLLMPTAPPSVAAEPPAGLAFVTGPPAPVGGAEPTGFTASAAGPIFVDVEGAVVEPGIRRLPAGSRVADAIAAAGGYATDADLDAAASALNLAKPLADGEQVIVPRIGDNAPPGSPAAVTGGSVGPASGGLVDLNTATPEQLEALPGIGAVTVQKIVAARQERPFASLEDAVERGVLNRGQLEDLQGLATAG